MINNSDYKEMIVNQLKTILKESQYTVQENGDIDMLKLMDQNNLKYESEPAEESEGDEPTAEGKGEGEGKAVGCAACDGWMEEPAQTQGLATWYRTGSSMGQLPPQSRDGRTTQASGVPRGSASVSTYVLCYSIYIYIYVYQASSIWGEVWPALIYIYIYTERERERDTPPGILYMG